MKKLLNTLYVTSPDRYLSLNGENVVVLEDGREVGRLPLNNLEAIVTFGYTGASPALMGECAARDISLSFLSDGGKFLARATGPVRGNVTLRRAQYRIADDPAQSLRLAKNFLSAKVYNAKWILERATRDHPLQTDADRLKSASAFLGASLRAIRDAADADLLRGAEGRAASMYFSVFDELILQQKDAFYFSTRSHRPPEDNVNAMLSFAYVLLAGMCASALEAVGLDAYVGFLHTDRPGRASLALDLMEEFRGVMADRFVLTLINKRIVNPGGFRRRENGAVLMDDSAKKDFLTAWQSKKRELIEHPFLQEKLEWGLAPHAQAMLLARFIRGDIDDYPPFFWK